MPGCAGTLDTLPVFARAAVSQEADSCPLRRAGDGPFCKRLFIAASISNWRSPKCSCFFLEAKFSPFCFCTSLSSRIFVSPLWGRRLWFQKGDKNSPGWHVRPRALHSLSLCSDPGLFQGRELLQNTLGPLLLVPQSSAGFTQQTTLCRGVLKLHKCLSFL